jgi:hypothetical protein
MGAAGGHLWDAALGLAQRFEADDSELAILKNQPRGTDV